MNYVYALMIVLFCSLSACDPRNHANSSAQKTSELDQREQLILAKEQALDQRELELSLRERLLDSASRTATDSGSNSAHADSLSLTRPHIPGLYNVTMKCTQTNCAGSAVGDTKNEQWSIAFEQNVVLIKAMSDRKLVRVYKGGFVGPAIELEAQPDSLTTLHAGKIVVRLQETKDSRLDGVREITREDDCRTVFELDLKKQ